MAAALTELEIRNAKPQNKKYTLAAGDGLTLIVMPDGSKYWRLRHPALRAAHLGSGHR